MANTNVIETHEDQAPESQEHIQEMIDKAEKVQSVPRVDGQPTWLPEKFESPEDLAEAYSQLEQKLSTRDTHQTEDVEVTQPSSLPETASVNEVREALGKQGIDFNKYAYEYAQNGIISDQSYGELEQQGLSEDVVNTWIAGQEAIANQTVAQAHESVGGLDEYNSLLEWAGNALPEREIEAFNRAIENPNTDDVVFAVKSLHARRLMEDGQAPTLLQGDTGGTRVGSFQSVAQLTKAMNDPRYQNDPAYRDEVTSKLSQSSIM